MPQNWRSQSLWIRYSAAAHWAREIPLPSARFVGALATHHWSGGIRHLTHKSLMLPIRASMQATFVCKLLAAACYFKNWTAEETWRWMFGSEESVVRKELPPRKRGYLLFLYGDHSFRGDRSEWTSNDTGSYGEYSNCVFLALRIHVSEATANVICKNLAYPDFKLTHRGQVSVKVPQLRTLYPNVLGASYSWS